MEQTTEILNNKRPRRKKRNHTIKPGKKHAAGLKRVDPEKLYNLKEAVSLVKSNSYVKFNASVDLHIRLDVDPKHADQNIRGTATLPHGTGKEVRVLVLTTPDKEEAAREAGAEYVGLDDFITKIQGGWTDIDVIICSPDVMPKVGRLGRVLGPRGLMPNPKSGTVTPNVANAVKEVKAGKIDFRVDKTGIVHTTIGKVAFSEEQLVDNVSELLQTISKLKPESIKGNYFKGIAIAPTMGAGVKIDKSSVEGL